MKAKFLLLVVLALLEWSSITMVASAPETSENMELPDFLLQLEKVLKRKNIIFQFILPQFPKKYEFTGPINIDLPGFISADGTATNFVATGIPSTQAKFLVDIPESKVLFSLKNKYVKLTGEKCEISGLSHSMGKKFNGSGLLTFEIKNLDFTFSTEISVDPSETDAANPNNRKVSVSNTNVDIKFESAHAEVQNLEIDGVTINWREINRKLGQDFTKEWAHEKSKVIEKFELEVNQAMEELTPARILQIIDT